MVTKSVGGIDLDETFGAVPPDTDMLVPDTPAQDMFDSVAPSEDVIIPGAPTGKRPTASTEGYLLLKPTLMVRLIPRHHLGSHCP